MWRLGIGRRQQTAGAADDTTTVDEAELERSGRHIFRDATATGRFPLTVYQLSGAAFTVLVQPDDDIAHLKSLIAKADTSLDAKRQHLYVSETESELQRGTLSSNGITNSSVSIFVVMGEGALLPMTAEEQKTIVKALIKLAKGMRVIRNLAGWSSLKNGGHLCKCAGVTVDEQTNHVIALDLSGLGLDGEHR